MSRNPRAPSRRSWFRPILVHMALLLTGFLATGFLTAPRCPDRHPRACPPRAAVEEEAPSSPTGDLRVNTLKAGLRDEYNSFFQPLLRELYSDEVSFEDPLISLSGMDAYKANIDMLGGRNALGKVCFTDPGLTMHSVEETVTGLRTRWTLQFRFRLLPWAPLARFTGVSDYTLDGQKRILQQRDYWDSINLQPGGEYVPTSKLAALSDFVNQLSPSSSGAQQASGKELPYVLLRRAAGYEVRRYPQHVAVQTAYFQRIDAFGTLGAYTNGANVAEKELQPYVPSLMSVRQDERSLEQITDDALDLKPSDEAKVMRWPLAVPAMREATPPAPNERL